MPESIGIGGEGFSNSSQQTEPSKNLVTEERKHKEAKKSWQSTVDRIMDKDFLELNKNDPEYKNNKELRQRQRKILSSLPANYDEQLLGHLKALYIDQKKFPNYTPSSNPERFDKKVIAGEIFEKAVEIEDDNYHLDPKWGEHLQTDQQKEIAEKILDVMANPERFNMEMSSLFNQDLIRITFANNTFSIDTSLEVKKHLDDRSLNQLKGFLKKLEEICEVINNLENVEEYGLDGLGVNGYKITISESYYQMIAVPRTAKLSDEPGSPTNFIDLSMNPQRRKELIDLINNPKKVKTLRSSFSHEELDVLTKHFYDRIADRLKEDETN